MDDTKLERHRFQFRLRKLLIWTAVWGMYLGFLKALEISPPLAVFCTAYLAVLLVVRITCGFGDRGVTISFFAGAVVFAVFTGVMELWEYSTDTWDRDFGPPSIVGYINWTIGLYIIGTPIWALSVIIVHCVVRGVDCLDNLMRGRM